MGAILEKIRSDVRARGRSLVMLGLIIGLSSGILIAAEAAARRTDSVLVRFNAAYPLPDIAVIATPLAPNSFLPTPELVRSLPGVRKVTMHRRFPIVVNDEDGTGGFIARESGEAGPLGRVLLLNGRMPRDDRPDEIIAGLGAVKKFGWKVGTRIPLRERDQFIQALRKAGENLPDITLTVVGTFVSADALPQVPGGGVTFMGTPALYRTLPSSIPYQLEVYFDPADKAAFDAFPATIARFAAGRRFIGGGPARGVIIVPTQRAFHLQASAMRLLAIVGALSLLLVFSQSLSRQISLLSSNNSMLYALGMRRRELWVASTIVLSGVGLVAGLVAALVAYLASPIAPLGDARLIELHAGLSFDVVAIIGGAAIVLGAVIALATIFARPSRMLASGSVDADASGGRPSAAADATARAGLSVPAVTGARFAFDRGRGRSALPARTAVAETALCIAGFAVALTCLSGLNRLLDTPRMYGKWWDVSMTFPDGDARTHQRQILSQPGVTGLVYGVIYDRLVINRMPVPSDRIAAPVRGDRALPITEGRLPAAANEIALGTWTMRDLHARIGQRVDVGTGGPGPTVSMRVVGRAVFEVTLPLHGLGSGALITLDGADRLHMPRTPTQAFVFLNEHATTAAAFKQGLLHASGQRVQFGTFTTPAAVINFANMRTLPAVLAGVLGIFGIATLAHAMMSVVRLRRRDLAILKAIGFDRRQIARTLAWQATLIVVLGLALGIPSGIVAGRFLWLWVATDTGGVPITNLPAVALIAIAPVAIAAANIVAAVPGRRAALTPAATLLRTE